VFALHIFHAKCLTFLNLKLLRAVAIKICQHYTFKSRRSQFAFKRVVVLIKIKILKTIVRTKIQIVKTVKTLSILDDFHAHQRKTPEAHAP